MLTLHGVFGFLSWRDLILPSWRYHGLPAARTWPFGLAAEAHVRIPLIRRLGPIGAGRGYVDGEMIGSGCGGAVKSVASGGDLAHAFSFYN